ncbi:uncharacterized protein C5orf34 homolog [Scyliorhinus canicula]|uniref:uncharacterized protein C5orf34 homolog n=1 Tax=Scyliorhinus canicula TaxID=7830 RepID=UPI0018F53734|nr:uncharacterized protein C5orf34 homolog [Scyliorhinus canicula]XP_038661872.1 uncharacterized protein C5orf34 homolog [Scyliorhinus canicula]
MALVSLMVLYEDDSVEMQFTDGSSLQLSPCGSEFLFEKAPAPSMHPLHSSSRVRQRTSFVISTYKEQVLQALEFRNRFASQPYLAADLIAAGKLSNMFFDISEVKWPGTDTEDAVMIADNGRVTVSSLGGHAFLYLAPSQLEFTVEFLACVNQSPVSKRLIKAGRGWTSGPQQPLSHNLNKIKPVGFGVDQGGSGRKVQSSQSKSNGASYPQMLELRDGGSIHCKYIHQYIWVVQHHTVSSCPPEWHCPLKLALHHDYKQEKSRLDGTRKHLQSADKPVAPGVDMTQGTATALPKVLPLNCPAPHLHRWRHRDVLGQAKLDLETCLQAQQVKVVWCQGVLYRVITAAVNSVEVYPGDGSVLKPYGASSNYFIHYLVEQSGGQREERMYMVSSLPPDTPNSKYSICSMVTQAIRILQCCNQLKLSLRLPNGCCWKTVLFQPGVFSQLPVLLHEKMIWGVGRFSAHSDGQVHISFCDGTRLNTSWDFGPQHRGEGRTSLQCKPVLSPVVLRETQTNVKPGCCQLLFPDGSSQLVPMNSAGVYEGYVTAAMDWCRWVSEGGSEQTAVDHPNPRVNVQDENRSVIAELQKIQRFNFLLENSNCLKQGPLSHTSPDLQPTETLSLCHEAGNQSVEMALRQTGQTIEDIELLLEVNKRSVKATRGTKSAGIMGEQRGEVGNVPLVQQGLRALRL